MEEIIMNLIVNGGNARSLSMQSIAEAKAGDIVKARETIEEASEAIAAAHRFQTELIQNESDGKKTEISLLLIHGQDHLMTTMAVKDMAQEFIGVYERVLVLENKVK